MRKLLAVIALCAMASPALAYEYSAEAQRVLSAARNATGGEKAWNALRGWQETGTWSSAGVEARYQMQADPVRYGFRAEVRDRAGTHVSGYNGLGEWEVSPTRATTGMTDKLGLGQARSVAFFNAWGFYFPSRFAAKGVHIGVKQAAGKSYDVLRIEPMGGGAIRELWFDRSTHLLGRMVDRNGPAVITLEYSDWRKVGAVRAPFRVVIDDGDPVRRQVRQVEAVTFPLIDRSAFSIARTAAPAGR